MDESPESLSAKSYIMYMNLDDLEEQQNQSEKEENYSSSGNDYDYATVTRTCTRTRTPPANHHLLASKQQLLLCGFCTGIVSQLIVFGCVDLIFPHLYYVGEGGETRRPAYAPERSSTYANSLSWVQKIAFGMSLLAISITSCLGVLYILSYMPIFRQESHQHQQGRRRNMNIHIRKDYDDEEEVVEHSHNNGMLSDMKEIAMSFGRRLGLIDLYFSFGHLSGGYAIFLITDLQVGSFVSFEIHLGLYLLGAFLMLFIKCLGE